MNNFDILKQNPLTCNHLKNIWIRKIGAIRKQFVGKLKSMSGLIQKNKNMIFGKDERFIIYIIGMCNSFISFINSVGIY